MDENETSTEETKTEEVNSEQEYIEYGEDEFEQMQKTERRKGRWQGVLISLLIVMLLVLLSLITVVAVKLKNGTLLSIILKNSSAATESVLTDETVEKLQLLEKAIGYYYLDEVSDEDKQNGLYKGLLEGLDDPYSVYYTEKEYQDMLETSAGTYYGIGAYLQQDMNTLTSRVTKPMPNSPAEKAGLKTDDIIKEVDGEDVSKEDLNLIVTKIKGEEGTPVVIGIQREGEKELLEFTIVRRKIEVITVEHEMLENQIGYIQILEFDDITRGQFTDAYEDLQKQGMQSLVLDLRDNPGGNVDVVVDIADILLPKGLIVYTSDKYGTGDEYKSDAECFGKPMVVLVNGNSASASEILAGAIRDYKAGTLLGTTTYGKGIVQQIIPLGDGTGVKLTIAKYFTPNGNDIHGIGIEPDETLEFDMDAYEADETDNQLNRAIEILK